MMRRLCKILCVFVGIWGGLSWGMAEASILGLEQMDIDFCKPQKKSPQVRWSPAKKVTWTAKGLGWDGHPASSWDGWVMSAPLAVGTSWRPARFASLTVTLSPTPEKITLANGQSYLPYGGRVYARFSPDQKHWSTWQPLSKDEKAKGLVYRGTLGVPRRASKAYDKLVRAYARRKDVAWRSDEEAMVRGIVKRNPRFFRKHKPFVGYVQVLWEGSFQGGRRLKRIHIRAVFSVSGLHYPPKHKRSDAGRSGPWRFVHPTKRP